MIVTDRLKGQKTLKVTGLLEEFEKDDVKKDINITRLFNHFGVELKKKGKNYTGLCPWHDDKNPSLSVDQEKGLYNCFGCGESGDAFTLVEKIKGYDFKESLKYLKDWSKSPEQAVPFASKGTEHAEKQDHLENHESTGTEQKDEKLPDLNLAKITEYYHKRLFQNTKALDYLKSRGLQQMELLSRFQIGFSDGTIDGKISEKQKEELKSKGIFTAKGSEHFKNCITFPIFDEVNRVVGIYGRNITEKSKIPHLYLKGKHKSVFNRKASKVYDEVILTESIIDAFSLIVSGFQNTQSIYGTNGFTEEHLKILKDDRVKTLILAFDNDESGKEASERIKEKLIIEDFQVKVIFPPLKSSNGTDVYYKDWNEYLTGSPDKSVVKELLENAEVFQDEENKKNIEVEKDNAGYKFKMGGISYRVSGVKDIFISNLRVNIKAQHSEEKDLKFYDNLDLYSARSRSTYSQNMARNFDMEPVRIEKDLITILEYLEEKRDRELAGGTEKKIETELTAKERELGMSFLTSPDMFQAIVDDMTTLGYVGEDLNKQLMYIAATSRKLPKPIPVMVLSAPASGKSYLIETVEKMIPPEDLIAVTSLSEQALNYIEDMRHKFLSLGEMVHSETIEHQIRELISKQKLTRLVAQKDQQTGKLVSRPATTEAIVSLAMSGTSHDVNPENASRFFIVNTDESPEQTRKIQEAQRIKDEIERIYEQEELAPEIIAKHHAAQKLIKSVKVANNFSRYLDFPNILMRTRRDNARFIELIKSVCFLRQYQKEWKDSGRFEYIECDMEDYKIAYNIMINGVLSSSFLEIPRGAIDLYDCIREYARKRGKKQGIESREVLITQRDIREYTGLGQVWIKRQMRVLVEYEYLLLQRGGSARSRGYYKLRDDSPMEEVNLSMIPTPEELSKRISDTSTSKHEN